MGASHLWRNYYLGFHLARLCVMDRCQIPTKRLVHRFTINQLHRHPANHLPTRLQTQTQIPEYRSHKVG